MLYFFSTHSHASCGATTYTWQGSDTVWNSSSNWTPSGWPDTSDENVVLTQTNNVIGEGHTIGCFDALSGTLLSNVSGSTLTVTGDYFRALNTNSLRFTTSHNYTIQMSGSSDQTFEVVDNITNLNINNPSRVTITEPGRVISSLIFSATGSILDIEAAGEWRVDNDVTIPSTVTVRVLSGATWYVNGNLTVNGVLIVDSGASLKIASNSTLSVSSGAIMKLTGSSGNVATVESSGAGNFFIMNINGTFEANYFRLKGLRDNGLNVIAGTISSLSYGEFRNARRRTTLITMGGTSLFPSTISNLSFYDDYAYGNLKNIDASTYTGTPVTVDNYSGSLSGVTFEVDPNNKVNWATAAPTSLSLVSSTPANMPGATNSNGSGEKVYAIFNASLNQLDTMTEITNVRITLSGSAGSTDFDYVRLYNDTNGNCSYDAGIDLQIGTDQILSGVPASTAFSIASGLITTSGPSDPACFIVTSLVSAAAQDGKTASLGIDASLDIVNDQGYPLSVSSGPPVYGNQTTINGVNQSEWRGTTDTLYSRGQNWAGQVPTLANSKDCGIGLGANITLLDSSPSYCRNASLDSLGTLDFNSASNVFAITGSLSIESGFTFLNATNGIIELAGTSSQLLSINENFPGHLNVNSTQEVILASNSSITGDLIVGNGVLRVSSGFALSVAGDVTVASGGELIIEASGILKMGANSTLTIASGAKLTMVGTSGARTSVVGIDGTSSISVIINGEISAKHYKFSHLRGSGLSIESGATVNATNNLEYGSFEFPNSNSTTLLTLKRTLPSSTLLGLNFLSSGSSATSILAIDTSSVGTTATLTLDEYSGDYAGDSYTNDGSYDVVWNSATTTITLAAVANGPSTMARSETVNMGMYGFSLTDPGSFNDAEIQSITLSLTGTGSGSDVSAVRLYADSNCDQTGGVLVGSGSFSGNPAKKTFSFGSGVFVLTADPVTPPQNCLYVEYDISPTATGGNTLGVSLSSSSDILNDQSYLMDSGTTFPINLGTPGQIETVVETLWTGSVSSDWNNASNWTQGTPDSSISCSISTGANNPVISTGVVSCLNFTLTSSSLTISSGATLDVFGNYSNTATLNQSGTLRISNSTGLNQSIVSSNPISSLTFNKTGGGKALLTNTALSIGTLTIPAANNFTFEVGTGKTLSLSSLVMSSGLFELKPGSTLSLSSGGSVAVNGGEFKTSGVSDSWPQSTSNKALITTSSGRWSFSASSGTVNLKGFILDKLDENGIVIGGNTIISFLGGGQFTSLSTNYSAVKAIQINTTGAIPASATQVYWTWGSANYEGTDANSDGIPDAPTPDSIESYLLVSSSGCGGQSIDFSNWTGDWFEVVTSFDYTTKVSNTNCSISLSSPASHVDVREFSASTTSDGNVDLDWISSGEIGTIGYNIYRGQVDSERLVRINETMIPSKIFSGQKENPYQYVDTSVLLGRTYKYYIQEVETDPLSLNLFGPASVFVDPPLGTPPPSDGQDDDPGLGQMGKYLGGGMWLSSQSSSEINFQLKLPDAVISQQGGSEHVLLEDYLSLAPEGKVELPFREFLVEVGPGYQSARIEVLDFKTRTIGQLNMGKSSFYTFEARDQEDYRSNHIVLAPDIVTINGRDYIHLKIFAALEARNNQDIVQIKEARFRVELYDHGEDRPDRPPVSSDYASSFDNIVLLGTNKAGLYRATFKELAQLGLSWLSRGSDFSQIRGYHNKREIRLEIIDTDNDGSWSDDDEIRFYANYQESFYDQLDYIVLSNRDLYVRGNRPLRSQIYNASAGDPREITLSQHISQKTIEKETFLFADSSLGGSDPYFWKKLINYDGYRELSFKLDVSGLAPQSETVELSVHLNADKSTLGNEVEHQLELINEATSEVVALARFRENGQLVVNFAIDTVSLTKSVEDFTLKVSTPVLNTNENDQISIDKIGVSYKAMNEFTAPQVDWMTYDSYVNIEMITNSRNDLLYLYNDDKNIFAKVTGHYREDAQQESYLKFFLDDSVGTPQVLSYNSDSLNKAVALSVKAALSEDLLNPYEKYDYVMIADPIYHAALTPLINKREADGMRVLLVSPEEIYRSFSGARIDAMAMTNFIKSMQFWSLGAPEYILFVGDGTLNTKQRGLISSITGKLIPDRYMSSLQAGVLPLPQRNGRFIDFQDLYASFDSKNANPYAIGVLPFSDPQVVSRYVDKVLRYEAQEAPQSAIWGFVGEEESYEGFSKFTNQLLGPFTNEQRFSVDITDINKSNDYQSFKKKFFSSFDLLGPYLLTYMGHGASNTWGKSLVDIKDLVNIPGDSHPVVMALSCDNAYFMNEDTREVSFSEALVGASNGAIAYIASTTWTTPMAQKSFASNFFSQFQAITSGQYSRVALADILAKTRMHYFHDQYVRDLALSMTFIGDPALTIPARFFNHEFKEK